MLPIIISIFTYSLFFGIIGLIVFLLLNLSKSKGYIGEKSISLLLNTLPQENYLVIDDILIKTNNTSTQIDHIVISVFGIFIIETKNYRGWIFGSDSSDKWTQTIYKTKHKFMNPIHQNYKHCMIIKEIIQNDTIKIIPIIAFSTNATLRIQTNNNIVYLPQIVRFILSYKEPCLSINECYILKELIIRHASYDKIDKIEHINTIKQKNSIHTIKYNQEYVQDAVRN